MNSYPRANSMIARGKLFGAVAIFLCALAMSVSAQSNLIVTVRHAPALNGSGRIEGSVQQLLGESVTLNGGFTLTGDLLVPGTPNASLALRMKRRR